ncbi:hypothetical protein RvY_05204 [Ramazzottius varieornatus]|uniref:SEC7 domain-containing protein n=1 Tax=Ramazzottius varieornatus TaxID=947166 RepID=A0A1D1V431_RAMVA|nr:hypothetical protein RvY_05204 [Ramazzottius varieornatus]
MVAYYLGNRKIVEVLPAFNKSAFAKCSTSGRAVCFIQIVCTFRSFNFAGKRIDEALREHLEAFRLHGESPLIAHFMEHFAANWHTTNRMPFRHQDCALRLAVRFLRRDDTEIQQDIMRSLRLLLGLQPHFFYRMSRQIANALYQLFQANGSSSIKSKDDWKLLCTLLECAGAGVRLPKVTLREAMPKSESQPVNAVQPDNERYTSDSELHEIHGSPTGSNTWSMVGREGEVVETAGNPEGNLLSIPVDIIHHDTDAFCLAIDSGI